MEKEQYIRIRKVIETDVEGYLYKVLWTNRKIYVPRAREGHHL